MRSEFKSPMPGTVIEVIVKVGDTVSQNDELMILESMKMETPLVATADGIIREIFVKEGDIVEINKILCIME